MTRSMLRDPEAERARILFPEDVNMAAVSRATKIPAATLHRYRQKSDGIPLEALRKIVKVRGITDEELVRIVRG